MSKGTFDTYLIIYIPYGDSKAVIVIKDAAITAINNFTFLVIILFRTIPTTKPSKPLPSQITLTLALNCKPNRFSNI